MMADLNSWEDSIRTRDQKLRKVCPSVPGRVTSRSSSLAFPSHLDQCSWRPGRPEPNVQEDEGGAPRAQKGLRRDGSLWHARAQGRGAQAGRREHARRGAHTAQELPGSRHACVGHCLLLLASGLVCDCALTVCGQMAQEYKQWDKLEKNIDKWESEFDEQDRQEQEARHRQAMLDERRAIELKEAAARKKIDDAEALKQLGNALLKSGDLAGALDKYTQAVTLDPGNYVAWANSAHVRLELGQVPRRVVQPLERVSAETNASTWRTCASPHTYTHVPVLYAHMHTHSCARTHHMRTCWSDSGGSKRL